MLNSHLYNIAIGLFLIILLYICTVSVHICADSVHCCAESAHHCTISVHATCLNRHLTPFRHLQIVRISDSLLFWRQVSMQVADNVSVIKTYISSLL